MITKTSLTYNITLYVAGFECRIKQLCQEFCSQYKLCVYVSDGKYCYNYGNEDGCRIQIINYPKYPRSPEDLDFLALKLGQFLLEKTNNKSLTIVGPTTTTWVTIADYDKQ